MVRTDNGPEFLLTDFYQSSGIIHQISCCETPQQNGRVERRHQTILNIARALLFQSKLLITFWTYATMHATFIMNRTPTQVLKHKTPFETLYQQVPDYNDLKISGGLCYASTLAAHRNKFESGARKFVLLGYKLGVKGYILLDISNYNIFVSRNVVFYDHILPLNKDNTDSYKSLPYSAIDRSDAAQEFAALPDHDVSNLTTDTAPQETPDPNTSVSQPHIPRSSGRVRQPPLHLSDYYCNQSITSAYLPTSLGCKYPLSNCVSYVNLSPQYRHFALSITSDNEPTYAEPSGGR